MKQPPEPTRTAGARLRGVVRTYAPLVPFACLPAVTALLSQAASVPTDPWVAMRALLVSLGGVVLVAVIAKVAGCRPHAAVAATASALTAASLYPAVRALFAPLGLVQDYFWLAAGYSAVIATLAFAVLRAPGHRVAALFDTARAVAAVVVLWAIGVLVYVYAYVPARALRDDAPDPLAAVNQAHSVTRPDVYHVIFDGFGRPDVLLDDYGLDLSPFTAQLRDRGFEVDARIGFANYPQTYLSVASMLNGRYLEELAARMGGRHSRLPLHELIERSAVVTAFKRLGYEVHWAGSIYSATRRHPLADHCECDYPLIGEFESTVLQLTPLRDLFTFGLDYRPHRRKLERSMRALETIAPGPAPRFVFAHVLAPHPPFVFDADGRSVYPRRLFSFDDGERFRGSRQEYVAGYRAQASYVVARALRMVDRFLAAAREGGRDAVIVVHGDHGPRSRFDATDPRGTDAAESLPVLLAIRWAPGGAAQPPVRSLVNVYRAFFSRYFRAEISPLPDRAFVSSFTAPYEFVEVPAAALERDGPAAAR